MYKILMVFLFVLPLLSYSQDPQSNTPRIIYPLLDEFIVDGFDRNYRFHTKILNKIDYIHLTHDTRAGKDYYNNKYGDKGSFLTYRYFNIPPGEWKYSTLINLNWANNHYVLRRIFFKSLGISLGLRECHKECYHIMSERPLIDSHLFLYDLSPDNWEAEVDLFFEELFKYHKKHN